MLQPAFWAVLWNVGRSGITVPCVAADGRANLWLAAEVVRPQWDHGEIAAIEYGPDINR
ncbi:MAG: hypothetical protein ACYTEX_17320 [Planctomycetota bacterium]